MTVFVVNHKIKAFKRKLDLEKLESASSASLKTTYHNRYNGEANRTIWLSSLKVDSKEICKKNIYITMTLFSVIYFAVKNSCFYKIMLFMLA